MMKSKTSQTPTTNKRQVVLTPLLIRRGDCEVVCVAIRDPDTQEIVGKALSGHELAEKAGIPLARAQEIFAKALKAAEEMKP
jgi:hypothetical protein